MGFIVHDSVAFDSGLVLENTYINIRDGIIQYEKHPDGNFYVSCTFALYVSYELRIQDKKPLKSDTCSFNIGPEPPNTNTFEVVYNLYKENYINVSDQ